jgi:hypothetical protein
VILPQVTFGIAVRMAVMSIVAGTTLSITLIAERSDGRKSRLAEP